MSIKIYNGLEIKKSLTLAHLMSLCKIARAQLNALVESEQSRMCARVAIGAFDNVYLGIEAEHDAKVSYQNNPYASALFWLRGEQLRVSKGECSSVPMGLEVCFFSMGDEPRTLAMAFGAEPLKEAFKGVFKAEEYGYWNNSDEPEGMDPKQWRKRASDWELALGKNMEWSPVEAGLSVSLVSAKFQSWWKPEAQAMLDFIGDEALPAARAKRLASKITTDWFASSEPELRNYSEINVLRESIDAWQKADGKKAWEKLQEMIELSLPSMSEQLLSWHFEEIAKRGAGLTQACKDVLAIEAVFPKNLGKPSPKPRI